jgi:hypothetical protein
MLLAEQLFHACGGNMAAAVGVVGSDPQAVDMWQVRWQVVCWQRGLMRRAGENETRRQPPHVYGTAYWD